MNVIHTHRKDGLLNSVWSTNQQIAVKFQFRFIIFIEISFNRYCNWSWILSGPCRTNRRRCVFVSIGFREGLYTQAAKMEKMAADKDDELIKSSNDDDDGGLKRFIWNSDTKEFCGRSGESWCKCCKICVCYQHLCIPRPLIW